MNTYRSATDAVSRPKITLMMILCGIVTAAAAGAVSAEPTGDDVRSVIVKYDPRSLSTDSGARLVYRRLVRAAEQACPDVSTATRLISSVVEQCRAEAVARAVHKINDPRLAAVYGTRAKTG